MNESGSQPDVLLQAWDAGLSRSNRVGQLVPKLQLPAEGRVTILALDLGDSVMIDTCELTSGINTCVSFITFCT